MKLEVDSSELQSYKARFSKMEVIVASPRHIVIKPAIPWPIWASALKQLSNPTDKGIGDVVARIIGDTNTEAFKAWHRKTFGNDCNCTNRRNLWNLRYPL